jgi:hypothetical protein
VSIILPSYSNKEIYYVPSAIELLPRTLETIGESISQKTGWYVTIIAGGPTPNSNGMIMTYLCIECPCHKSTISLKRMNRSHTGQTKEGDTFEKFLGPKQYDEYLLDFEKFLHASFCKLWVISLWLHKLTSWIAKVDCELRCILHSETETVDTSGKAQVEGADDDEGKTGSSNKKRSAVQSDYELRKEKNIKELKMVLDRVKEMYPMPKDLEPSQTKKPKSRKKQPAEKGQVVRRESQRRKGKEQELTRCVRGVVTNVTEH